MLVVAQELRIVIEEQGVAEKRRGVQGEIHEAENLVHAKMRGVALIEAADHIVDRSIAIRSEAKLLLHGRTIGIARCIEQRDGLAACRDRHSTRKSVRQALSLFAITGHGCELDRAKI